MIQWVFLKDIDIYGKNIKLTYEDGSVVSGFWSDWFFVDDNDFMAEYGEEPCESIVLDHADAPWGSLTEVLETEIVKIEEV